MINIFSLSTLSYVVGYIVAFIMLITFRLLIERKGVSKITADTWIFFVAISALSWITVCIFSIATIAIYILQFLTKYLPKIFDKPFTKIDQWLKSKNIID